MNEITKQTAIAIAEQHLNEVIRSPYDSPVGDRWVISMENIQDCGDYWLMHYQSEMYLKTENPSYLLAGNLPINISKTGKILGFGK